MLSHLLSSQWQQDMQESEPKTVLECPPLAELIADLPLHIQGSRKEDAGDYAVLLQVVPNNLLACYLEDRHSGIPS